MYDAVVCVCTCECGVCECVFVMHMCVDVNCECVLCVRCVDNDFGPEGAKELSWIGTLQQLTELGLWSKCSINVGICSCRCMKALVCGIGCARIRGVDMWIGCCSEYICSSVYGIR